MDEMTKPVNERDVFSGDRECDQVLSTVKWMKGFRLFLLTFVLVFILTVSAGMNAARAEAVSETTLFGTWKLEYVMGSGADGLNAAIDAGTQIYYFFSDDELSGLSIASDGTTDRLAKRSYSVSNGVLRDGSGADLDVRIQDGVLHMKDSNSELLLIRADLDFLKGVTWNYVALKNDNQPDLVQTTQEFLSSGGSASYTFGDGEVAISTTQNGNTNIKYVPYSVQYDNVLQLFGKTVEVLIAEDKMIITDGATWQFYEKYEDAGSSDSGSETPSNQGTQSISESAVRLDLMWNPNHGSGGGYVLLINGNPLNWEQGIASAVSFCSQNGIMMDNYENGDGHSLTQEMVFAQNIPLISDYGFYVDQGAAAAEGKLHTIRMYSAMNLESADEAASLAQDVYDKLQATFGMPTDELSVYTGSDFVDAEGNNIYSAVKQMANSVEDNYGFVGADFNNLTLYVSYWDGKIDVYLNLSIN